MECSTQEVVAECILAMNHVYNLCMNPERMSAKKVDLFHM